MTFEVEVAGRIRTVVVEPGDHAGRFRVTLDGAPHVIEASRLGDHALSFLRRIPCGEGTLTRSTEVSIVPGGPSGEVMVSFDGRTVTVALNGRRTRAASDAGRHAHGDVTLVAPMPGRVVRVLVGAGDEVAARQGVVVVEAMKMENELQAPRAGRVKEISVGPGMSVDAGRILAVIE